MGGLDYSKKMSNIYGGYWKSKNEREGRKLIEEIPFMISEEGKLICLPKEVDVPNLGVVALPRTGKSWIVHGLIDRMFWYWKLPTCILNDSTNETLSWGYPFNQFRGQLSSFGENPLPLPTTHLYPNTNSLSKIILQKKNRASVKIGIPLSEIIKNCHQWFDLGNTEHYFKSIVKDLVSSKDKEELFKRIDKYLTNPSMNLKLKNHLTEILDEGIVKIGKNKELTTFVDVTLPDKNANGTLRREKHNVFSAMMRVGLVPVLHSYDLLIKQYYPSVYRYFLEQIYDSQMRNEYFKNKRIFMFIDEILRVSSTQNKTVASKSLEKVLTRTGHARIGFAYASQSYLKLDPFVQRTTRYLFALRFNTEKEAKAIAKDYDLHSSMKDRLLNLDKMEFMAMTNEKFISYDNYGNKEVVREAVIGKALPPLSRHLSPNERLV